MFQVAILLALALGANAIDRQGRSGDVRVFNFLDSNAVIESGVRPSLPNSPSDFTSTTLQGTITYRSDDVATVGTFSASDTHTLNSFQRVDLDGTGSKQMVLTLQGVLDNQGDPFEVCSVQIQPNVRNTIVVTQQRNGLSIPTATCTSDGGQCFVDTNNINAGTMQFSCQPYQEDIDEPVCGQAEVAIFRNDDTVCPVFVKRGTTGITGLGVTDQVFTGAVLENSPSGSNPILRSFDETVDFSVDFDGSAEQALFTETARFHEVFCGPNSCNTDNLKTAFVKVVNANFRVNANNNGLDSQYTIVIRGNGQVLHVITNLGPTQASPSGSDQFVELPLNAGTSSTSFSFQIYDTSNLNDIFGSRAGDVAPTATAITSPSIQLSSGEYAAVVLTGTNTNPSAQKVSLSNAAVTENTVTYQLINTIQSRSLEFAAPADDCCNFLEFDDASSVLGSNMASKTVNTGNFLSGPQFNAYVPNAACTELLASLISPALITLDNDSNGSCKNKAIFFFGRQTTFTQTSSGAGSDCSSCDSTVSVISPIDQFNDGQSNNVDILEIEIPTCDCVPVAPAPVCTVCEKDEFADLTLNLDAIRATVASINTNLDSDTASVIRQVKKVGDDLESEIKDGIDDLESEIKDVEEKIN